MVLVESFPILKLVKYEIKGDFSRVTIMSRINYLSLWELVLFYRQKSEGC